MDKKQKVGQSVEKRRFLWCSKEVKRSSTEKNGIASTVAPGFLIAVADVIFEFNFLDPWK